MTIIAISCVTSHLRSASDTAEITADPDVAKFMACAKSCAAVVVSGDQHMLDASGWEGVEVLKPRDFLARLSA
jgi:predicted nucleic acid-binding protein